jgi:hypothetical protein
MSFRIFVTDALNREIAETGRRLRERHEAGDPAALDEWRAYLGRTLGEKAGGYIAGGIGHLFVHEDGVGTRGRGDEP